MEERFKSRERYRFGLAWRKEAAWTFQFILFQKRCGSWPDRRRRLSPHLEATESNARWLKNAFDNQEWLSLGASSSERSAVMNKENGYDV